MIEHLPDVTHACFEQVVCSVQVPHSGPTQVLQPAGEKAVTQVELSSGQSALVEHVEPLIAHLFDRLHVCVLTLLQVCEPRPQVCVW